VILGKQEAKSKTVTIRKLGSQEKYSYPLKDYLDQIVKAAKK
jgi:histidyl-tRNA synthetase